ncbi:DDE-type integrase/transposase/recombinase [Sphingobium sp. EM0848]|uniref:DDE-type integrase/transposase/recombinase n=1 Tax=Sphingobium sp. EM0848 TaxID=2743473 RepID=UPI00350EA891
MVVKINEEKVYLWRAVDHEGEILESYVTKKTRQKCRFGLHEEGSQTAWIT